jgi:hypothetical protein
MSKMIYKKDKEYSFSPENEREALRDFIIILIAVLSIVLFILSAITIENNKKVLQENTEVLNSIQKAREDKDILKTIITYEYIIYHHDYSSSSNYEIISDTIPMDTTEYMLPN